MKTQDKGYNNTRDQEKIREVNNDNPVSITNVNLDDNNEDIDTTGNPFDMTSEDREALGEDDLSLDGGDDEQLQLRTHPVNFSGDDLDIPGAELDDILEEIGYEDEENNPYSLGGDNHQDLEEDKA